MGCNPVDIILDPIGGSIAGALGVHTPMDLLGSLMGPNPVADWNTFSSWAKQDWIAFKHLLVPDMRRDREQMIQSATNARTNVYGRTRVSGQIAYIETSGDKNQFIHILTIHAGHEIDGYEEVYFDDHLVANASGVKPTDWTATWTAGSWAIQSPYAGKATIEFFDGTQTAACASMVSASAGGWTVNHKLLGVAYTHIMLTYDQGTYPAGLPTIKVVLRGKKVWDFRNNTIGWSSNPILCKVDYLTTPALFGGAGADTSEINLPIATVSANKCDEIVYSNIPEDQTGGIKTSGSVGSYPETRYTLNGEIKLDGTPTQFIKDMLTSCAGDAVYSEGEWKIYPGAPATPVATIDESWLNGGLTFQTGANKNDKVNTAKGTFTNSNDYWADTEFPPVPVGVSTPPNSTYWAVIASPVDYVSTNTYSQNQYVLYASKAYQAYSTTTVPVDSAPPNSTYWVLIEEHDNSLQYPPNHIVQRAGVIYESTTTVPVSNQYIAEDGGEVLTANLVLPFTITSSEAQRLAKIDLEKSRRGFTMSYPCNHKAFPLDVMDVVAVNNNRLGMTGQLFRVVGWNFSFMGGTGLSLAEYDAAIYDWSPGDSTPLIPPTMTNLPDPRTVAAPTDLLVIESLYSGNVPSVIMAKATVSWVSGEAQSTVFDVYVDGKTIASNYRDISIDITDMTPGLHTFGVRGSNTLGAHSTVVEITYTITGNTAAPSDVTGFTANFTTNNLVLLSWSQIPNLDRASYELRQGASWDAGMVIRTGETGNSWTLRPTASGTLQFWIKAINTTGKYSANATGASVTIPAAAAPTAITCTSIMFGIALTVTYPKTQDIDYCEIWASTSDNRNTAVIIGITRDGTFQHQGLGSAAVRYYWARTVNVFGEDSAWYPGSATGGIQGITVADPGDLLTLLNGDITQDSLANYLAGQLDLLPLLDTGNTVAEPGVAEAGVFTSWTGSILAAGSVAHDASIQVQTATAQITQLQGEIDTMATATTVTDLTTRINTAESDISAITAELVLKATSQSVSSLSTTVTSVLADIDAINASIALKASQGSVDSLGTRMSTAEVNISAAQSAITLKAAQSSLDATNGTVSTQGAELDVVKDRISLKLDSNGNVAGMVMGWETADSSSIIFLSNVFKICQPNGSGVKNAFTVGTINGSTAVGISGDLFIDGSVDVRCLAANQLIVGTNVAMGSNATISWSQVTGKPTIPNDDYITNITQNTVTTTYVNALNVAAASVHSDWEYTGTLTAAQVNTSGFTAQSANIATGAITNGKIGTAEVGTLSIAGNAVTVPVTSYYSGNVNWYQADWCNLVSVTIASVTGMTVLLSATGRNWPQIRYEATEYRIARSDGTVIYDSGAGILTGSSLMCMGADTPGAGTFTYYFQVYANQNGSYTGYTQNPCLTAFGAKR